MHVYVSFLRGVNVGGHNKIKMDALRDLYRKLGFHDPRTYVQSGNVVFGAKEMNLKAKVIEDAIEKSFGFRPGVVLRTAAELSRTINANPFAKRDGINPGLLLVSFLGERQLKEGLAALRALPIGPEEMHLPAARSLSTFPTEWDDRSFPGRRWTRY